MREFIVQGDKTFRITVPDDAKVTFGPWSPPKKGEYYDAQGVKTGTLRIYQGSKDNIIACFSGVKSFRDLSIDYMEEIAKEEGTVIWKSDNEGYVRETKSSSVREWIAPEKQLPTKTTVKKKRSKK